MRKTNFYTLMTAISMSITMLSPVVFALLCINENYLVPTALIGMSIVSFFLYKTFKSI